MCACYEYAHDDADTGGCALFQVCARASRPTREVSVARVQWGLCGPRVPCVLDRARVQKGLCGPRVPCVLARWQPDSDEEAFSNGS